MKRSNILVLFILMGTVFFSSCDEDTVDLLPIGDTEADFFRNEEQMTQAVFGVYSKLSFFYTFSGSNWLSGIWVLPGDNITTQGGHGYEVFSSVNGSDGRLTNFYRYSYQLINRANTVLEKIDAADDSVYEDQPELKDYHKGEVLFLRSWMYFRLWNTYGSAAPLVTERITNFEDAYPPSSQGTELLDQAIEDLQLAAQLLPGVWDGDNLGRVTKNSAHALRGKILVFRGTATGAGSDFTDALTDFNAISGASLMSSYRNVFDIAQENGTESLFEYQANEQSEVNNPFLNNDAFATVGDLTYYCGMFTKSPAWIGDNTYVATESLINAYELGDPRLPITLDTTNLEPASLNVIKYTLNGESASGFASSYNIQKNNPRILRYADVLLLQAEALVRSGGSKSQAVGLINQIRQRARFSTSDGSESTVPADRNINETNTDTILDWIFYERRIELACEEGHRWYDLRRRYMAGEIDLTTWDFSSLRLDFNFLDGNEVFPIPTDEISNNPNLIQNSAYN